MLRIGRGRKAGEERREEKRRERRENKERFEARVEVEVVMFSMLPCSVLTTPYRLLYWMTKQEAKRAKRRSSDRDQGQTKAHDGGGRVVTSSTRSIRRSKKDRGVQSVQSVLSCLVSIDSISLYIPYQQVLITFDILGYIYSYI